MMAGGIFTTAEHPRYTDLTRVLLDGQYVGHIRKINARSFQASRLYGAADDMRKMTRVRSFDAALVFVTKQMTAAESAAIAAAICAGPGPAKA